MTDDINLTPPIDFSPTEESKQRRAHNREASAQLLAGAGIYFASSNAGAHLIVSAHGRTVDFWPGTGLWIERGGKRGRGVFGLIRSINHPRGKQ